MKFTAFLIALLASAAALAQTTTAPITGIVTLTIPAPIAGPTGPQGPAGVSPTPAAVAAACVASPPCVAAIAAAVSAPVVAPPPPPPPVPPSGSDLPVPPNLPAGPYSVAGTPDVVFARGVLNWPVDFTYGGLQYTVAASPTDSGKMVLKLSTPQGTGGWQPGYQNPPPGSPTWVEPPVLGVTYKTYDTTGKNFLNLDVYVTMANCTFLSAFLAANDSAIPGANVVTMEKFGGPLVVGKFVRLKIPLGIAGYNLPAGQKVLKFNVQENNPMPGNVFYIDNAFFSAT
jgi:hypothetical protein